MSDASDPQFSRIEASLGRLHNLISEIEDILETLIANDTEILEALTQILLVVPQMQARNEQSQAKLVEHVRQELSRFAENLSSQLPAPAHAAGSLIATAATLTADPETALLQHLYSFLPLPIALDIGANIGDVSEQLLHAGYEIYAFEPNPPTFEQLQKRFDQEDRIRVLPFALGSADGTMSLHVAVDPKGSLKYGDPSLFSSLIQHPMPFDLPFTQEVSVQVRTVESLRCSGEIPARAGLIKIDTEGYDLEVIRGLGEDTTPVVMCEFWNEIHSFGSSGKGRLEESVREMRRRGYFWYLVIYHLEEKDKTTVSYYANRFQSPPNSWGNAIFFREQDLFSRARAWCEATLGATLWR